MVAFLKRLWKSITPDLYFNCLFSLLAVAITTAPLVFIGIKVLSDAVIALLYLIPVGWSAARFGQGPGILTAFAAALAFDYFFIPPYNTFTVGSLEGWMVLLIFMTVAIVVVGRIQSGLNKARESEREALFMYELSTALSGLRTQDAVMQTLARHLQQLFQAALVEVFFQDGSPVQLVRMPEGHEESGKADRILPILAAPGLVGEIRIWRGHGWLPPEDSRLLRNFSSQANMALERAKLAEAESKSNSNLYMKN